MTHKTQLEYYIFVLRPIRLQLCLIAYIFLPEPQVQAFQLPVHISYFLHKCKKGKPFEMDLPYLKTISQKLRSSDIYTFIAELTRLAQVVISYYGITKKLGP